MASSPEQAGPIAVYGASGFTGRLVASELRRRGADFLIAGRSRAKLEILAEDLGGDVPICEASLDDRSALRALLEPCSAVIACAGPFAVSGEPVLAGAVDAGTHYLDTTGEQAFMRTVFEDYGTKASEAGVALVTAMGFDYVPGDMIASLTADGMESIDEVVLAYAVSGFGPTRGTLLSALGIMGGEDFEWRDGRLTPGSRAIGAGIWEFPEPVGQKRMIRYPAGEHITVPRHVATRTVRTLLTAETVMPVPVLPRMAPVVMPPLQLAARTPIRRALAGLVARLPEGPSPERRRKNRFTVVCEARGPSGRRRGVVTGSDLYGVTARTTVEGALRCAAPGYARSGALAPAQAFEPVEFLEALAEFGVEYETESL